MKKLLFSLLIISHLNILCGVPTPESQALIPKEESSLKTQALKQAVRGSLDSWLKMIKDKPEELNRTLFIPQELQEEVIKEIERKEDLRYKYLQDGSTFQYRGPSHVCWSPDGNVLWSKSIDGTGKAWNPKTRKELFVTKEYKNGIAITFLDSGRKELLRKKVPSLNKNELISPDGKKIAEETWNSSIIIRDRKETGKFIHIFEGHKGMINSLSWNCNGLLASGGEDSTIRIWNTETKKPLQTINTDSKVNSVTWDPSGRYLASGLDNGKIIILTEIEGEFKKLHILEAHSDFVNSLAWSPNGKQIASSSVSGEVKTWKESNFYDPKDEIAAKKVTDLERALLILLIIRKYSPEKATLWSFNRSVDFLKKACMNLYSLFGSESESHELLPHLQEIWDGLNPEAKNLLIEKYNISSLEP